MAVKMKVMVVSHEFFAYKIKISGCFKGIANDVLKAVFSGLVSLGYLCTV